MKLSKLTVRDVNVLGKRVLVRVDFNVPLTAEGKVANAQRIMAAIPTIEYLLERGAKSVVLMSHLGRPDGKRTPKLSLRPVGAELERLIGRPVLFLDECVGDRVAAACAGLQAGSVVLLENLRFHVEEEGKVKREDGTAVSATEEQIAAFRHGLSSLGDIYVNDAFGAVHRAHSSITGIEISPKVAGMLIGKELEYFGRVLESPDGIDLAILGGAKVSDKIQLIQNLLPKIKSLAIGGGMIFTFLKVLSSMEIGKSLYDEQGARLVPDIVAQAKSLGVALILPSDFITGSSLSEDATVGQATVGAGIPAEMMGLDIGPVSTTALSAAISQAKSVLWNGPVGVFEISHFAAGTAAVVRALVASTAKGAITIVGGGDSGAAVAKWNAEDKLSHVSTGGGASLELLEGHVLPGIAALTDLPPDPK